MVQTVSAFRYDVEDEGTVASRYLWWLPGCPVSDRSNPDNNNFRGYGSLLLHKTDTKTASRKNRAVVREKVGELVPGKEEGERQQRVKGACRVPFVSNPPNP